MAIVDDEICLSCEKVTYETNEDLITEYIQRKKGKPRWYTKDEIKAHCTEEDCWVVINQKIFNITPIIKKCRSQMIRDLHIPGIMNENEVTESLRCFGGTDISHWFSQPDPAQGTDVSVLQFMHPESNTIAFKIPHGLFPGIYDLDAEIKNWWNDWEYIVGLRTCHSRDIRLVNMLTSETNSITVCHEETINEILSIRYLKINQHAKSYTWKYEQIPLDMTKTLQENHIPDEREEFISYGMHNEDFIPAIQLYYNDDLTIA